MSLAAMESGVSQQPPAPRVVELSPAPTVMDAVRSLADRKRLLLLESAAVRPERGRYSFLMADPIREFDRPVAEYGSDPFAELRHCTATVASPSASGLPPFQGGVAGVMAYELGGCWERVATPAEDLFGIPVLSAGLYSWVIAWDHLAERAWVVAQGWSDDLATNAPTLAEERCRFVLHRLSSSPPPLSASVPAESAELPEWAVEVASGVWSDFAREDYLAALRRVIEYIYAGDIFQANLTQRLLCRAPASAVDLYERLRACNPAPFAGLYQHDDWAIVSASPERFIHLQDGVVTTRPIKGTRRRSARPEADLFTRDLLRQSEKDQAENVMIVDLLRNDLSRVCRAGSVHVPQLCQVETFATVQHLVSEIRGTLVPGQTMWDVFAATLPGGSITGAPKVRAMEIIAELEPTVRGPYTGSLFYVGHDGAADSNLLIRTFVMRRGWLQCGVGGGIVAQSDPNSEYDETWHKAAGMLRALGLDPLSR